MPEPVTDDEVWTAARAYNEAVRAGADHPTAIKAALESVAPSTTEEIDEAMAEASRRIWYGPDVQHFRLVPVDDATHPTPAKCGYDWPNCDRPVVDTAVHHHPSMPLTPACEYHLREMADPAHPQPQEETK